jgi:hypothetical protein
MVSQIKDKYSSTEPVPARELLSIHRAITGSCKQGALSWVKDNNINLDKDNFTLVEFFDLVYNAYGADRIRELKNALSGATH